MGPYRTTTWTFSTIGMLAWLIAVSSILMACSFVPREGPLAIEIDRQGADNDYVVVDVNSQIVQILGNLHPVGLSRRFTADTKLAPASTIGVGDELAVTIWEAGEGGLFSNQQSKSAAFPSVVVDRAGKISLP